MKREQKMQKLLTTKLFVPKIRPDLVSRPQLIGQLNEGLHRKLTLISAPAGFGKTTLVSEWVNHLQFAKDDLGLDVARQSQIVNPNLEIKNRVAWLSLDEGDSDLKRFLTYLVAALQTISNDLGREVSSMLQSPQLPSTESILTTLLNEINTIPQDFILVLDDYHLVDARPVDNALSFLLERLPPQMHVVIATREDPNMPLARLRARGQLTELRVADLRFTLTEAAEFLNQVMGLILPAEDIAALETRTEGWITGLQLAAISMRGHKDTANFIKSFTGSHHFVLDYLVEEVLLQQPESIQTFLLRTSILDRLCGPLCDAVLRDLSAPGQEILESIEQANLFIIPLDNERRWYRYHHLFADLLRQRLLQGSVSLTREKEMEVAEFHIRASTWFEDNGLELEAFQHAAAANDVERAARLIEGDGMPLQFRGAMTPVPNWLESLPKTVLDARPSLWVTYASALTMVGKPVDSIEEILLAAEAALESSQPDNQLRDLTGHVAAIRAMLAIPQNQVETIIAQSRRALGYLHPENLSVRATTSWTLGYAYQLQGDRTAAIQAHTEALSISQASGNTMISMAAITSLGQIQESENQLRQAVKSYKSVLQLAGEPPLPAACEAHLGLARIFYEWNDLKAAQRHGEQSLRLTEKMENVDTPATCELLFARLKLAQGDVGGAVESLANAEQFVRENKFVHRLPEIAALQAQVLLRQCNLVQAANLAKKYELPVSQARVHLAQNDVSAALSLLESYRQLAEAKEECDERLKAMILQAIALHVHRKDDQAMGLLEEILTIAEPGGFVRIFVDEGPPMADLLTIAANQGVIPHYIGKLLGAFEAGQREDEHKSFRPPSPPLFEPLSQRELEILELIAQGLSNREISEQLFLALNTVKGHNRNIFNKLQVQRRTEAVARARKLNLL